MLRRRRHIDSARWLCLRCATASRARAIELGIRPEHVEAGGDLPAVIEMVEPMGSDQLAWLRLGDHPLSMRLSAEAQIVAGGPIPLRFPADKLNLFDAVSGRRL